MSSSNRNVILISLLLLGIVLLTMLSAITILEEDDDLYDDDFLPAGVFVGAGFRIPVPDLSFFLMVGMSIFALVVVYLGGRSGHKRFNDRTLEFVNDFGDTFFATALLRAVFIFLFLGFVPGPMKHNPLIVIFYPIMIPYTGGSKP